MRPIPEGRRLLRSALRNHGLTYAEVAAAVGVTKSTVWKWAAGEQVPDLAWAFQLEDVLGVPAQSWVRMTVAYGASGNSDKSSSNVGWPGTIGLSGGPTRLNASSSVRP